MAQSVAEELFTAMYLSVLQENIRACQDLNVGTETSGAGHWRADPQWAASPELFNSSAVPGIGSTCNAESQEEHAAHRQAPPAIIKQLREKGLCVGDRLADEFFAANRLYQPIKADRLEEYIYSVILFFTGSNPVVNNGVILISAKFYALGGVCSAAFFAGLLSAVFRWLCPEALFFTDPEQGLCYRVREPTAAPSACDCE